MAKVNKLLLWLALLIVLDLGLLIWRWTSTGMSHSLASRAQGMVTVQIFMSVFSAILYKRCSGSSENQSPQRILARLLVGLFLVVAHSSWLFFYVYLPENSLLVVCCFLCVSVYVHWAVFLIPLIAMEKVLDHFFPTICSLVLNSKNFHTYLCLSLALLFTAFGLVTTKMDPIVQKTNVLIPGLPDNFDGFTIALVTDVHIGPTVGKKRVEEIVDIVNSLDADMVAIAGDLVDGYLNNLHRRVLPIAGLKAKQGVFFATGNHEYYFGSVDDWLKFFSSKLHLKVLRNSHHTISLDAKKEGQNGLLCVVGLDDLVTEKMFIEGHKMEPKKAVEGCPPKSIVVVLAHQPNAVRKIIDSTKRNIHLILSGHTHNGQLYIFWPFAYFLNDFIHGLYKDRLSGTQIYVSAGVNFAGPPVKIWNNCEIVLIKLKSDGQSGLKEFIDTHK